MGLFDKCFAQAAFLVLVGLPTTPKNLYAKDVFTSGFWGFTVSNQSFHTHFPQFIFAGIQALYPTLVAALANCPGALDEAFLRDASLPPMSPVANTDHSARIEFATPSLANEDHEQAEKHMATNEP